MGWAGTLAVTSFLFHYRCMGVATDSDAGKSQEEPENCFLKCGTLNLWMCWRTCMRNRVQNASCAVGLLGGARDAEMLAAATAANAYLLQQQQQQSASLAPPGPYTTAAAAAAAAMMMLPPPSPLAVPFPPLSTTAGDAPPPPPPLSRVSPAPGVDLGLRPDDQIHRHADNGGARYVQTMADG